MNIKVKFSENSKVLKPNLTESSQGIETELGDFVIIRGDDGITPHVGKNGNWWLGGSDTGVKADGKDGTSVSIESVTESTASGGSNVVTFSDGTKMTVKNGEDYQLTDADKAEIVDEVEKDLPVKSVNGKTGDITLNADDVGADAKGSVSNHNVNTDTHNDIRLELTRLAGHITDLLNIADSNDSTLDELHEIVDYIKSNKSLIDYITDTKVNVSDVINNLASNVANKPLSAAQGVVLKVLIDGLSKDKLDATALASAINTALAQAKASGDFKGDPYTLTEEDKSEIVEKVLEEIPGGGGGGGITEETDPTVPDWAKEPNKPSYTASEVGARPNTWTPTAAEVGARPVTWMPSHTDVGADKAGTAQSLVSGHNTNTDAHNDIRLELQRLGGIINDILDSEDPNLDEMHEVVAYIKSNAELIEAVTIAKVNVADIINNLTTNVTNKPLSAAQGVALKALIDAITVPTKVSELTNDSGYQTASQVNTLIGNKGYQTASQVNTLIGNKGYQTETQVNALINNALGVIENGTY